MKFKSTLICLSSTTALFLSSSAQVKADPPQPENPRPTTLLQLTPEADHMDSTPTWSAGHDFGEIKLLDALSTKDDSSLEKLNHAFSFLNKGTQPIEIDDVSSDCGCTVPNIENEDFKGLPYIVKPGGRLRFLITIDPQLVAGGQIKHTVTIMSKNQVIPLAEMDMMGFVDNGIGIQSKGVFKRVVRLAAIPAGVETRMPLTLIIDKRAPLYFEPGSRLKLVSSDENLSIRFFSQIKLPQGVSFEDGCLSFAKGVKTLPEDIELSFSLTQLSSTPTGPVKAFLVLASDKTAPIGMMRHIAIPIKGLVIGRTVPNSEPEAN